MNYNDSTLISKLNLILLEDLKVISGLESKCKKNTALLKFLKSLRSAKQKIINKLEPISESSSDIPAPPTSDNLIGHNNNQIDINSISLLKIIYDIEETQFNFVKKNMGSILSERFKKQWSFALDVYIKITDQISRMLKTSAINSITI